MIAGLWPRKVTPVEHISKHVSKTKVIFKCSYVTADLTPEDKVYSALVCPTGGRNSYLKQLHVGFFFLLVGLVCMFFNLKTRISSILSWPKYLASHDPLLTMITIYTHHLQVTTPQLAVGSTAAAQQPSSILPLCLTTENLQPLRHPRFWCRMTVSDGYINCRSNIQSGHRTLTHQSCWHDQPGFEDSS